MVNKPRLILEVGCGPDPWLYQRLSCLKNEKDAVPVLTPVMEQYANDSSDDQFICLDKDPYLIKEASEKLRKSLRNGTRVKTMVGDGQRLPFAKNLLDAVILHNVLSAPVPGTGEFTGMGWQQYPTDDCISSAAKWRMIREGLRVLKKGGSLIIGITLTPCYTEGILDRLTKKLVDKGMLKLTMQCGELVNSDNWHLYHAVYQKAPFSDDQPTLIPWTEEQQRYIQRYANSWSLRRC